MRLYIDTDTRNFLLSATSPGVVKSISYKRRDTDLIELQFIRDGVVQELSGTAARFGLKPAGDYDAPFLSTGTFTKSGTGTSTRYLLDLNLNTTELAAAFTAADEPETLAAMAEVEWSSGTNVFSSVTLPVTIANDVIRGDEGAPATLPVFYTSSTSDFKATQEQAEEGTDNSAWMSPLRTRQAVEKSPLQIKDGPLTLTLTPEQIFSNIHAGGGTKLDFLLQEFQFLGSNLFSWADGQLNFGAQTEFSGPSYFYSDVGFFETVEGPGLARFDRLIPVRFAHTFTSANQATAYNASIGGNVRVVIASNALTADPSFILQRNSEGATFGDILRIQWSRTSHTRSLLVRHYPGGGTSLATLATLSTDGVYGYAFDGTNWVTEASFTGL
jgi:hypothetical protein